MLPLVLPVVLSVAVTEPVVAAGVVVAPLGSSPWMVSSRMLQEVRHSTWHWLGLVGSGVLWKSVEMGWGWDVIRNSNVFQSFGDKFLGVR